MYNPQKENKTSQAFLNKRNEEIFSVTLLLLQACDFLLLYPPLFEREKPLLYFFFLQKYLPLYNKMLSIPLKKHETSNLFYSFYNLPPWHHIIDAFRKKNWLLTLKKTNKKVSRHFQKLHKIRYKSYVHLQRAK